MVAIKMILAYLDHNIIDVLLSAIFRDYECPHFTHLILKTALDLYGDEIKTVLNRCDLNLDFDGTQI